MSLLFNLRFTPLLTAALARWSMSVAATAIALLPPSVASSADAESSVRFGRDIRPILSDKCYFCHGPDEENRAADLRLDDAESARDAIDSGELLHRIRSGDPDEQMPPPEAKHALSDDERKLVESWIEDGGAYEAHWAFEPLPDRVEPPKEKPDAWSRSELDRFVHRRAADAGFAPAGDAEPRRWLRRATLDLTGMPPTVDEIEAFLQRLETVGDPEDAYAEVVDRLLASEAYGEHMAVAWLDAARYADSYGYQSDLLNTQWPYRDWVVKALNDNLPYDDFLVWQLAGDLLDDPTHDQRLATAFNRLHRLNNEGGAVFEEWRLENVADRVHTFGTVVLGLTLECCRCHDHKYDPIPTRDYYSLSAFFNSIDESGVYDQSQKAPSPALLLPTSDQAERLTDAREAVRVAEAEYAQARASARDRFEKWSHDQPRARLDSPDLVRALSLDTPWSKAIEEVYFTATSDRNKTKPYELVSTDDNPFPAVNTERAADRSTQDDDDKPTEPRRGVRLDGDRGLVLEGISDIDRWTPFSLVVNLKQTKPAAAPAVVAQCSHGQLTYNGWDLMMVDGHLESRMYRDWPGNAIGVRSTDPIPTNEWVQIAATYDGSSRAAGLKVYLNGQPLATTTTRDRLQKRAKIEVMHGGVFTIGQRFRDMGLDGAIVDDVSLYSRELSIAELRQHATGEQSVPNFDHFVGAEDGPSRRALGALTEARKAYALAEEAVNAIPVMEEMPVPRETHVLARGAYDAPTGPDTRVERDVLSEIGAPFPSDLPRDRLGLARWATDGSQPLTARVAVNRLWANFFGEGLVRTPENFGLQGELPTHPDLLDWLARDFVDHGWDVKRLCRQITLCSTYRQDSRADSELREADPENRLLARGPAHRLTGEQIRDLGLAASGLLNPARGGPPVSPYQPGADLWKESNSMSPSYKQSVGVDLYRRSLYSVWKRTAPLPNMMAFDSQSREVCTVKRPRTNTPLQALVLLNDPQFVEAARSLASRALQTDAALESQVAWAFESLASRPPDELEIAGLVELFGAESRHYAANPEAAEALTSIGETPLAGELDKGRLAAMTVVCQAIMNLDATVWKR